MSIPVLYANTEYISGSHKFKTISNGSNMSLTELANSPSCNVITIINDKVGIGTTLPRYTLDIIGTLQTNNLKVMGNVEYSGFINSNIQVSPIRKVFYVDKPSQNIFDIMTSGFYGANVSNVQIFVGQNLLKYYSDTIKDYTINVSYSTSNTVYSVTLQDAVDYGSLVDITIWPTIIPLFGLQSINVNNYWQYANNSNDIYYYTSGNVGIGTTNPQQPLHIQGNTHVSGTVIADNLGMYSNRILNGDMRISQFTSAFLFPNLVGSVNPIDRFSLYGTVSGKLTAQLSADGPTGFTRSLMITSTSSYTPTSNDRFGLLQNIEGYNIYDFMFGTANATSVSISFWVKSSLTGTFSLRLANGAENQNYVQTYTITNANTWEQKQVTIPGRTSGTWDTEGGIGFQLYFDLGGGSATEGTDRSWLSTNTTRTPSSVELCQTSGATWKITGVQLEKGSMTTAFDRRPFTTELTLSRSYFSAMDNKNTYGYASAMQFGGYLDLGAYNGSLIGYAGGFTDGKYAYYVPFFNGTASHGLFTRVDLANWTPSGISFIDVSTGNASAKGFHGLIYDGRYVYLIPHSNGGYFGIVTRVDLQNFTTSGVSYVNVTAASGIGTGAKGFIGGFTDGRYGYLVPYNGGGAAILTRIDFQNFTTSGVTYLDVTAASGVGTGAKGFIGGFINGGYGYLVPYYNGVHHGILTRVDLQNFTTSGVSYLDVSTAGNTGAKGFRGGFTDGRYAYLVPTYNGAYHGIFTRVDLNNFTTTGVTYLDVSTAGNTSAKGFIGGFTDGRYAYLMPHINPSVYHGILTRVELANFTTTGVTYLDVSTFGNGYAKGFMGGFTDGNYAYFVPHYHGTAYSGVCCRVFIANTFGNTSLVNNSENVGI